MKKALQTIVAWCDSKAWPWILLHKVGTGVVTAILSLLPPQVFLWDELLSILKSISSGQVSAWWLLLVLPLLVAVTIMSWILVWKYRIKLGKIVTWCHSTLWPKAKSGGRKLYFWSEPKAKWLWAHKAEKRVWVSAAVIAVLALLFFGTVAAVQSMKVMTSGNWQPSWLFWLLLVVLGAAMVSL